MERTQELRQALITLIEQLSEDKLQELLQQAQRLSRVESPLLKLRGIVSSRSDGASQHDEYLYAQGTDE